MKNIILLCQSILFIAYGFGQDGNKVSDRILGAWVADSFELFPNSESTYGLKEEPVIYLFLTRNEVVLRGSCNFKNDRFSHVDNTRYSVKKRVKGDTLTLRIKNSEILEVCGEVEEIKVISINDSTLKMKSFINDNGYVVFKRMSAPNEVSSEVYSLLQGRWIYQESYLDLINSKRIKSNPRDSIVSFVFKQDSVQVSFLNNAYETVNTTYSIIVTPWFNSIVIEIDGMEEKYCEQIPRLSISNLSDISASNILIHMCNSDSAKVKFTKVE